MTPPLTPTPRPALFDEREVPFPEVYERLLRGARRIDVALTNIRLTTLTFGSEDFERLARIRLLLARVNAESLELEAAGLGLRPERRRTLRTLVRLLDEGIIEVRAAPLAGWSPDFTVFWNEDGPGSLLGGPHWFGHPAGTSGPTLGAVHGPDAARRVGSRFEEAWRRGHDIGAAIVPLLSRHEVPEAVG